MNKPSNSGNTRVTMSDVQLLPPRSRVPDSDQWDLSSLFKSDADWEQAFALWEKEISGYARFKGKLGESAKMLLELLEFDSAFDRAGDRLGCYANLKTTEDQSNSEYQRMRGRFQATATAAAQASSFIRPELMAVPVEKMNALLVAPELAPWRLELDRTLRYRPHTLGDKEEQLLAMQGQMSRAATDIFRQLNDSDLKWPPIENEKGQKVELGHSSFAAFLRSPDRTVRSKAFHTFYTQYEAHKNTLAATFNASVQRDVYYARARGHASARESALFQDNVPVTVYDNLINSVHSNLPALHRYYDLRRRAMKLSDGVHHYDTYVPILSDLDKSHTWDQAVEVVLASLAPLGEEYTRELRRGFTVSRWADRYPNQGKQSGAFSSGCFDSEPFILMNYQPEVLDHVFTLTHEAGHSMHTYFSAKSQPFQYHQYRIFVAEVASTFNEQLLARHMMDAARDDRERAYLINRQLDGIRGTIFRQTMFAEFEKNAHAIVEAGEPLTVEAIRREYRKLLEAYFGPKAILDPELELEGLRIPHFYGAFYVYKYATGLSAAVALSERVLNGGKPELDAYLNFLKAGCSKWPLDLLRDAGVDMETPAPVNSALKYFDKLVSELDGLLS
jgi:oligoendopeptidase F